eukprot:3055678-Rhodomonas_salina.9
MDPEGKPTKTAVAMFSGEDEKVLLPRCLSSKTRAMPCTILPYRPTKIHFKAGYVLRIRYEMSAADLRCAATRWRSTSLSSARAVSYPPTAVLCHVRYSAGVW